MHPQPGTNVFLAGLLLAGALNNASSQASELQLQTGKVLQGTLQALELPISFDIPAGKIAQVRFAGEGMHLELRNEKGQHVRRLIEDGRGTSSAMWQVHSKNQEQLWIVAADSITTGSSFELELTKTWTSFGPEKNSGDLTPIGPRLQALVQSIQEGGNTQSFWNEIEKNGAPLIEPWINGQLLVTFLWRDQGNHNVRLFGNPSGDHNPLQRLEGSDVWWTSIAMDPRARITYGFAPDVPEIDNAAMQRRMILSKLQRDPLNPQSFPARFNSTAVDIHQGKSLLSLPQAPKLPWRAEANSPIRGTLTRHVIQSQVLGNTRDIFTYVPQGTSPHGLLVLFDAHAYLKDVNAPQILDWLTSQDLLPSTAIVMVGNASPEARGIELPPNPKFAQFMAQELMPWVKQQNLGQLARNTVVAGSSYGGLVSSYLALVHPELFGNVISMSGSYWWAPSGEATGWMQRAWKALPTPLPRVHFYIDAGLYETGRGGRTGILETSRELGEILRSRDLLVTQREWVSGHDYVQWQASLGCGLVALINYKNLQDPRMSFCTNS